MTPAHAPEPPQDTRARLLQAALAAFGHRDYEAVSTREIVDAAGANISAISYHFGGKKALYLATAAYLAKSLHEDMGPTLDSVAAGIATADAASCRERLLVLVRALVREMLLGRLSRDAAGFIFREQNDPSEAFDILYRDLMQPLQASYATLLSRILGGMPGDRDIVLLTHALLGQIIAFRMARGTLLRRLGRARLSAVDVEDIAAVVTHTTLAAVAAGPPPGRDP